MGLLVQSDLDGQRDVVLRLRALDETLTKRTVLDRRLESYPDHPILKEAWRYEIIALRLKRCPTDESEPFLDLTLQRDGTRRTLRFWSPQSLEIGEGGPTMTHGLEILDIRSRGWDRIGVRVDDFENNPAGTRFYARSVEELGKAAT